MTMAPEKRKHAPDEISRKPSKKRRTTGGNFEAAESHKKSTAKADKATRTVEPSHKTVLVKEQPLFPRGGGGALTPLERKQIHARAERDAEREFAAGQDLFGDNNISQADSDGEGGPDVDIAVQKATKKTSKKDKKQKAIFHKEKPTKIHGLSYKRLKIGSLILGCIVSISDRDLTVALPNNLIGFVPITAISNQFTSKIEKVLGEDIKHVDDEDNAEDDISLEDYFQLGQYLRVVVTSTEQDIEGKGSRKRLEFSVDPSQVNIGLQKSTLAVGCMAQVAVSSIEDHGLVVDLGIEGENVRGFVPASTLPSSQPISKIREGAVLLCQITHVGSNGKVVKLSADPAKFKLMKAAADIETFTPGSLTEILITEVQDAGIAGKIMGMLNATADIVHSGAYLDKGLTASKFKVGKKIKGRLVYTLQGSEDSQLGFSVQQNLLDLQQQEGIPSDLISSTINEATVCRAEPGLGIYLDLGEARYGFAHMSHLADKKIESISESTGPYRIGSQHKARILDFNPTDNLFAVSLRDSILQRPFLRLEDLPVGEVVKGTVEKLLIGSSGLQGLIMKIVDGIAGLVPPEHLSDVKLQHPERKFKEGAQVKARVLSVDRTRRRVRLTLKKTLVNSDAKIWTTFEDIEVGNSSLGTLTKIDANGALVQFYGTAKGFLPVSEMSEAYIKDAREHFRIGQVLNVNAISIDPELQRLILSCRDVSSQSQLVESNLAKLQPGQVIKGTIFEKSSDDVQLRLEGSDVIARLTIDHVSDGSLKKRQAKLDKMRVGQKLDDLLILDVQARRRLVTLSNRRNLVNAAQEGKLLKSFEDLQIGREVVGFVSNVTSDGVFVSFAARISGLITPYNVPVDQEKQPEYGFTKFQTVSSKILHVDYKGATPRFWLTTRELPANAYNDSASSNSVTSKTKEPVDPTVKSKDDLIVGRVTKARITSIKETQLNVELAEDVHGRIDVSEIFDTWEDIADPKKPLRSYELHQVLDVKILGAHDTRTHRFLPLTHRTGKNIVYELTAKPSQVLQKARSLTPDMMPEGSSWIGFVNNISSNCLWISISPSVRGMVKAVDVSDNLSLAANLESNFPIGSALQVRVLRHDKEKARLDLTAKTGKVTEKLDLKDLSQGLIRPGRVTKVSDRQILVQLSDDVAGAVDLIDLADDYDEANPAKYQKNEIVHVCVVHIDTPNKRLSLSTRPSRVLSSSIESKDPEITSVAQLNVNDTYRGFVRNVDDKGLFVTLGHGITAFIRVAHLSDDYLKEWKDSFQRDQLITGKIISVDKSSGHVQMSLKKSILEKFYVPPVTFGDLSVGDVITGKAVKIEEFGVFILVDNSENLRGLCHRNEIAEQRIPDARKLFNEGDVVKAKILKLDSGKRRINFGMKMSYFTNAEQDDASDEVSEASNQDDSNSNSSGILDVGSGNAPSDDESGGVDLSDSKSDAGEQLADSFADAPVKQAGGLKVGGFDWYGISAPATGLKRSSASDTDYEQNTQKKKRKKKREIQIDRTGDLDANGPQSVDDFERLLLGSPDSSLLWLQYMAFHVEVGDLDQARQVGERALKTIGLSQDLEKMNVWVALLNLESAYGDEETLDAVFMRACEYNDPQDMHTRLTSIYIQSGKHDKADEMFQLMLRKFAQDPKVWMNYATYLFDTAGNADKARDLLARALQTLPSFTHLDLTSKFGQLEFKSSAGLPERGRTIFEGLINSFPKRVDLYNILLDHELRLDDKEQIRALFERIFVRKLKPKQAKYFFKRWLAFEEKEGDEKRIEDVKAKAATWIRDEGQTSM